MHITLHASEKEQQQQRHRSSVSDYIMGGHHSHAGKLFDFDTRISGVASSNHEKSIFDDDLVSAGGNDERKKILASIDDNDEPLPKWATRNVFVGSEITIEGTIDISEHRSSGAGGAGVGMMIQNDEISWEPFYVTIETTTTAGGRDQTIMIPPADLGLRVTPSTGYLAPRGGANNACDESKPYSDCWEINVSRLSSSSSSSPSCSSSGVLDCLNSNGLY